MAVLPNTSPVYVALRFVLLFPFLSLETSATSGVSTAPVSGLLPQYDALYYRGVRSYFAEDWEKAAELIEKSIETRESILRRRRECHDNCVAAGHDRLEKLGNCFNSQRFTFCCLLCKNKYFVCFSLHWLNHELWSSLHNICKCFGMTMDRFYWIIQVYCID